MKAEAAKGPRGRFRWLPMAGLLVVTAAVYSPLHRAGFLKYDDPAYVTENPQVLAGLTLEGARWALTTGFNANWHPLTWLSHMLDVQLFGQRSGAHHLVNVAFHMANTALLYWLLVRLTGAAWRAALAAALFALHPLRVESVAWVSERKDVLSTALGLGCLLAYERYARAGSRAAWAAALLLLALGLAAKPMLVTLPFLFLLVDLWPLGRAARGAWGRLVLEKLPFFLLAAASSWATYVAQEAGGAVSTADTLPWGVRIENAVVSYADYLRKAVWPADLAIFYPHPYGTIPPWKVSAAALFLAAASALVLSQLRRRPWLAVGWAWYLGTLVPVIGLVQVGIQSMADRYTYLSLIGPAVALAWSLPEPRRPGARAAMVLASLSALAALATLTARQARTWVDARDLFGHALAVTLDNHVAHHNLANALFEARDLDGAIHHFQEAIRIKPNHANALNGLGNCLIERAMPLDPSDPQEGPRRVHLHGEAERCFREALRHKDDHPEAHCNLASVLALTARLDEAETHYRRALDLRPRYADAHNNLGVLLVATRRREEGLAHYREALAIDPAHPRARVNLEKALEGGGP
ncbi:MAG: tetratricopeptide repeat protein [Planctomycetes bacterium]|nr:tetratricopeptide repeat protein [Planctomycetota bacterium]